MRVAFAAQAYQSRATQFAGQRLVNLYAEMAPEGAASPLGLFGTPGLVLFSATGATGAARGLSVMDGVLYAVCGTRMYRVSSTGTATALGSIPGADMLRLANNGTQLVVVRPSTGDGWVYSAAGGLQAITDPDWLGASSVDWIDQYGIFTRRGTGQFFISALADLTSYDALDIATAESAPDDTVRVIVDHREVWLFGSDSVEIWHNSGAAAFPFERIPSGIIERGCAAAGSCAKLDNTVFWLGNDKVVYRAQGYIPQRISTHAIEYALSQAPDLTDVEALAYTQDGHGFYCLTIPQANNGLGLTLCYDAATGLWHERVSGASAALTGRWRAQCFAYAYGRLLAGDAETGDIYELSLDTYTEAGTTRRWLATSPPVVGEGNRVAHHRLEVQFEAGVGLSSGQGEDPTAVLRWSDDGGKTWAGGRPGSLGRQGEYGRRVYWNRLGASRNRVYEISGSDPVQTAVIGATLATTPLGA